MVALLSVAMPIWNFLSGSKLIGFMVYVAIKLVLISLLLFTFYKLNKICYRFHFPNKTKVLLIAIVSTSMLKVIFILLKARLDLFPNDIVMLFAGGTGILFIYEAAIYIWVKRYNDGLQSNINSSYLILLSKRYNLTEIFMPYVYSSTQWDTLSIEE